MNKILLALSSILAILDNILKNSVWAVLTNPIMFLNALEIVIIILVATLIYRWLPRSINRIGFQLRAKNFYANWLKFKEILCKYQQERNPVLQTKYEKIRKKLLKDFGFFFSVMKKIHEEKHDTHDIALNNLESCFLIEDIKDWSKKIHREIPRELDCFDRFIASIEGYYNNS
ncbi:MAG: hypothetical protein PHV77_03665 [Candidatus Omnitrophica bacterium]|jgi:hypothetical protein|nr:hypothetical protein [Candidatus Omnitrophota bacterium]